MAVTLHTSLGDLKFELYCEHAPVACENFLRLCASDYYVNTVFHRNIKGFLVQGGDPTNTGKGGRSAMSEDGDGFSNELVDSLKFSHRGILAMANSGKENTNKSQFFVTYAKAPSLNGMYTIMGRLISGQETLDVMEKAPVQDAKKYRPKLDMTVTGTTIHANPFAEPVA